MNTSSALHHIPHRTKKMPPLRVGIGGPVGSCKTTLLEMLCKNMRERWDLIAITNDIYTKEDQRLLTVSGALPAERIMGVETGGCPHTAIREDASINLEAIDRMLEKFPNADVVFIESGGDNLAATSDARRHPAHAPQPRNPPLGDDQPQNAGWSCRSGGLHRKAGHAGLSPPSWPMQFNGHHRP